jgi:hypothetical protein
MKIFLILVIFFLGGFVYFLFPISDNSSPEYFKWKAEYDQDALTQASMEKVLLDTNFNFDRVELIEVGPGKVYYSLWGHLILRFVGSGKTSEEDLSLSFLAYFSDFPVNRYKASFGGYTVLPKLAYYKNYVEEYQIEEKRFMHAYPITLTQNQKDTLLLKLRSWVIDKSKPGTYSFMLNNCVGVMIKLFIESDIIPKGQLVEKRRYPNEVAGIFLKFGLIRQEDYLVYANE